ncbi:MAG: BREX-2 system phosphatase PglZ [Pseudomonadota bacterium]
MAMPALSTAQIAAQLDAVLESHSAAEAVAIRAPGPMGWPGTIVRKGRTFRLRWCESRLAMREALLGVDFGAPAPEGLLLLTPLTDNELPDDVAARLFRARIFQPRGWDILKHLFAVKDIDARLVPYDWMPQLLIDHANSDGFAPVATGFLDLDTAWREVLSRCLRLEVARPDASGLMHWALQPDVSSSLGALQARARSDILTWLASNAGAAGGLIVRCVESGRAADATALGLVCDVLFSREAEGSPELAQAAVRLERFVGNQHVGISEGRDWARHALQLLEVLPSDEGRAVLDRADALLLELRVTGFVHLSDWLPAGLEQRLARFAEILTTHAAFPDETTAAELEEVTNNALRHRMLLQHPMRNESIEMARRLGRWLVRTQASLAGFDAHVARQADDSAWVDWARFRLLGGDELPALSAAYGALRAAVAKHREETNKSFAAALATHVKQAQSFGARVVSVESILNTVVAPLAVSQPVLLLVMDGLSIAIFRELWERPERHGWVELMREDDSRPLVGVAALPTVTEVSRASLLSGRICVGVSPVEKAGFAGHAALMATSSSSQPPRLFHKGDLSKGGNLSSIVREALANPAQKVVGVVYNAVDDHLGGPDQLHQRWRLEDLRLLLPLLREARDARRALIVTADHGHVLEENSVSLPGSSSDRWREGSVATDAREVALAGSRVLTPQGNKEFVGLWSEAARYTGRKNGYHGGASPAEVAVPLSVFASYGVNVSGWKLAPPQQPEWWELPALVPPLPAETPLNRRAMGRKPQPPTLGQAALFGDELQEVPAGPAADWIAKLLVCPVYVSQRQLAARVALPDEQMRRLLVSLDERGGKLNRTALAQRLGVPELRLAGVLSAARRLLNVDQSLVLAVDESSGTVELNRRLLDQQFGLGDRGGSS